jgi:hemerythrin-like domain-containing protein
MNHTETTSAAWLRRDGLRGEVDFTMMYVAHDAFSRDLSRLIQISSAGRAHTSQAQAIWAMFSRQLHVHHTAEDTSLWPRLRVAVTDADDIAVLDAMEAEHAALDPQLEGVEAALHGRDGAGLVTRLRDLASGLAAHMRHEEDAALPLIDRRLGRAGWAAFGRDIRKSQGGIRGGAEYLPWVLDAAPDQAKRTVLGMLPAPARLLYRRVWEPRYRRAANIA